MKVVIVKMVNCHVKETVSDEAREDSSLCRVGR